MFFAIAVDISVSYWFHHHRHHHRYINRRHHRHHHRHHHHRCCRRFLGRCHPPHHQSKYEIKTFLFLKFKYIIQYSSSNDR